jgi:hypothetical protein
VADIMDGFLDERVGLAGSSGNRLKDVRAPGGPDNVDTLAVVLHDRVR